MWINIKYIQLNTTLHIIKCNIFICNLVNINVKKANAVVPFTNIPLKVESVYISIPILADLLLKKLIKSNKKRLVNLYLN